MPRDISPCLVLTHPPLRVHRSYYDRFGSDYDEEYGRTRPRLGYSGTARNGFKPTYDRGYERF